MSADAQTVKQEFQTSLAQAREFFKKRNIKQDDFDPTIADTDGFVTYINGSSNEPPENLKQERKEVSAILEGLTGIVVAAVLQVAENEGSVKPKHDPAIWREPIEWGLAPFIGGFTSSESTYNREIRGIDIATSFLDLLFTAVVTEGAALAEFSAFLATQGDAIRLAAESDGEGYKFATIGMIHEIFEIEKDEWIYVPKIQAFFTEFTVSTFKLTSNCVSYDHFQFDFRVEKFVAPFKIEMWRQEEWFRTEVKDFIKEFTQGAIDQSKNYFDGIFKSNRS